MTPRAWPGALVLAAALSCGAAPIRAQDAGSLDQVDSLIAGGRIDAARAALTDWLASHQTPSRADAQRAIWQRALLTVDPTQAALDYQRLVVEYPGGRYSDRALLRLAQAAQAEGDPARAQALVASLLRDYPSSPARLEASTLLEGLPAAADDAAASTAAPAATDARTAGPIEERAAESDVPAPSVRDPVPPPRTVVLAPEPEEKAPSKSDAKSSTRTPAKGGAKASAKTPAKAAAKAPEKTAQKSPAKPPEKSAAEPAEKPAGNKPAAPPADTAPKNASKPAPKAAPERAAAAGRWTVQVGAFASPERAQSLERELAGIGVAARVVLVPGSRLIRVRTGRFVTQADAERERDRLAARDLPASVAADADREEAAP